MEGATIGQYRVTGLIGQGGMGAVYAAEHSLLGRQAAIKVLLPDLSQKQEIVQRFFNEARAATAIRHPGIVEVYDFGWTPDGAAFIVMERLDGETLARRAARGRLRWQVAIAIARQIAGALSAAHAKGIVHRDLKPENVFLVPDPEVPGGERIKLLDFGIAKLAGDTAPMMNVTRTGAVMGTPTYMSPEQCRGVAVDHRTDLYALGCVLFELCGGRPPFIGEGSGDVLAAHIHMPPPALAHLGVEVPLAFEQLVQRLLTKPPAGRVQSADELIRAIDAVVAEPGPATALPTGGARPVSVTPSMTTLSGASTSRRLPAALRSVPGRSVAIVAGTAAAVTVAIVAVVMLRGGDEPPKIAAHAGGTRSSMVAPAPVPSPVEPPAPLPAVEPPPVDDAAAIELTPEPAPSIHDAKPAAPKAARVAAMPAGGELPATVDVVIDSNPPGAQILLAGTRLGKTPFRGTLPRSVASATIVVRLAGYADKNLVVHPDRAISERIKLVPAAGKRDKSVNPF